MSKFANRVVRPTDRGDDYSETMQNRCFSPRMRMRFEAGTGEPMTDSAMLFSESNSNLSLAMLASVLFAEDRPPFLGTLEVVAEECVIPLGWRCQIDHLIEQDRR